MPRLSDLFEIPAPYDSGPPRFVMSLHKSGSTMANNLLQGVFRSNRVPFINMPTRFFNDGLKDADWSNDSSIALAVRDGIVYTGFRYLPNCLCETIRERSLAILVVRDPRDALVSAFFSFGPKGSHVLPRNSAEATARMLESRKPDEGITIDEWVLKRAATVRAKLEEYSTVVRNSNFRLFKYEEILFSKRAFVLDALEHLAISCEADSVDQACAKHHIIPSREDPTKHIRKALPGDHREKLQAETIDELNRQFKKTMETFGYELG